MIELIEPQQLIQWSQSIEVPGRSEPLTLRMTINPEALQSAYYLPAKIGVAGMLMNSVARAIEMSLKVEAATRTPRAIPTEVSS